MARPSNNLIVAPMVALVLLLAAQNSRATVTYSFVFDQSNYDVAPGGTVDVTVSLQETVTGGSSTQIGTDPPGLAGLGALVTFNTSPPTDPAEVLSSGDIAPNSTDFNNQVLLFSSGASAGAQLNILGGSTPKATATETSPGSGIFQIPVATLTFTAGAVPFEVTNLVATDPNPGSIANSILGDGTVLDSLIANGLATITTVPEPGSFVLLGLVGILGFGGNVVRKKYFVRSGK